VSAEARSVVVRLTAETAQYISAMQAAGKLGSDAMEKVDSSTKKSDASMQKTSKAAKAAGLAIGGALVYAGKAAVDWESQWAGVEKTVDGTATQMAALEDQLRGMARTMPESHQEIAAVAEAAGQLGVAREDVSSFTRTMLELGETTNLTSDQAATDIAQIQNVMGTAAADIDNFGAALVALGNNGASTEAQILGMAQRIAGAGAQIGLTESDILGIANAAASMGVEVEAGGSAISRVFTSIAKATKTGGDKLDVFAQTAGMSSQAFVKAFEDDPARAFATFVEGLDRVNKSGGDVFSTLDALGLSDVRVSQALLSMASAGDYLTDSLNMGKEAWSENSALAEEFAKRMGTDAAKIQVAWNNVRDAAIDFGGTLLPVISDIASGVSTVTHAIGSLPDPMQSVITKAGALTLVVGGAGWFGVKAIGAVRTMRTELAALGLTADTTRGKLANISAGTGAAVLGLAALDGALTSFDLGNRKRAAENATADSVDELVTALSDSRLGKYADDLHIDLQRLAQDLVDSGTQGTYASEVFDKLGDRMSVFEYGRSGNWADKLFGTGTPKSVVALQDLNEIIENNSDLLDSNADAAGDAAAANDTQAKVADNAAAAAARQAEATKRAAAALKAQRAAARQTAKSFVGLGDSLDDGKVSLDQWISDLQKQADALRNVRINAQKAADNGIRKGLIKALEEAGPAGAMRLQQLANATEDQARRANRAWDSQQREVGKYVDAIGGVPKNVTTEVKANTGPAMSGINAVEHRLDELNGKRALATIEIRTVRTGNDSAGGPREMRFATGGPIFGEGGPRDDRVAIMASNGEHMWTAREVANAGGHGAVAAIRARYAYADGGAIGTRYPRATMLPPASDGGRSELLSLRRELKAIRAELVESNQHARRAPDLYADATASALDYSGGKRAGLPWR